LIAAAKGYRIKQHEQGIGTLFDKRNERAVDVVRRADSHRIKAQAQGARLGLDLVKHLHRAERKDRDADVCGEDLAEAVTSPCQ
jgi:hypothetical protein